MALDERRTGQGTGVTARSGRGKSSEERGAREWL